MNNFNVFIDNNSLVDLSLIGKMFTRSRLDEECMNILDHFLLFVKFCEKWNSIFQWALEIGLPDHFPIMLSDKMKD